MLRWTYFRRPALSPIRPVGVPCRGPWLVRRALLESPLAEQAKAARTTAWLGQIEVCRSRWVKGISEGFVAARPPLPDFGPQKPNRESKDLSLHERLNLLNLVVGAKKLALDVVASNCQVDLEVVNSVIKEISQAMVRAGISNHSQVATLQRQTLLLCRHDLWESIANQKKHSQLLAVLASLIESSSWRNLELLWNSWKTCRDGVNVALTDEHEAMVMVQFLLEAGIRKRNLLIVSRKGPLPLSPHLADLGLERRTLPERNSRCQHWLQMCSPGITASSAHAAALSMLGVHWLMLSLGSVLISKGVI